MTLVSRAWSTHKIVGGYRIADPLTSDVEAARHAHLDLDSMGVLELRVERRHVEHALVEARRLHLDPDDHRVRWLRARWEHVGEALDREEAALSDGPRGIV